MGVQIHHGKRGRYEHAATGHFFPLHPEKYKGIKIPEFKSALELRCMQYLDKNPAIISWSYEPKAIKYVDRSSNPPQIRRYFIDFVAIVKQGLIQKTVWLEVKPYCEAHRPKNPKNVNANLLWIKNSCKWAAASQLAKQHGFEFHVITERELN